jgi:hypothetical protein
MSLEPNQNPLGLTPDLLGRLVLLVDQGAQLPVSSEQEFQQATKIRDQLNQIRKDLEAAKERAKRPFINENRRIDGLANVLFDQIKPAVQRLDSARTKFRDACKNPVLEFNGVRIVCDPTLQSGEVLVVQSGGTGLGVPVDMSGNVIEAPASVPVMRTRTVQVLEITDESLVPREYLDVNETRVKAALVAGTPVPGARLVPKEIPL